MIPSDDDDVSFMGFDVQEFQLNPDRLGIDEMPHIDADMTVAGKRLGVVDLRIERYPIPPEEKKKLFHDFSTDGLVGTFNGVMLHFKPDYSMETISPADAAKYTKLPEDWESHMVVVEGVDVSVQDNSPKMVNVFKGS